MCRQVPSGEFHVGVSLAGRRLFGHGLQFGEDLVVAFTSHHCCGSTAHWLAWRTHV